MYRSVEEPWMFMSTGFFNLLCVRQEKWTEFWGTHISTTAIRWINQNNPTYLLYICMHRPKTKCIMCLFCWVYDIKTYCSKFVSGFFCIDWWGSALQGILPYNFLSDTICAVRQSVSLTNYWNVNLINAPFQERVSFGTVEVWKT
jgi:hypothetical protein